MEVNIRPIELADVDDLNHWKNDRDVYQYLGGGYAPTSIDQHRVWMQSIIDLTGNNRRFIIEIDKKVPVGLIGLYDIHWIHRTAELGLFIGEPDYQGKGIAKIAYKEIENYASQDLNLRKLKLKMVKSNDSALKFWTGAGYQIVGEHREDRFIQGIYHNVLLMEKFL